MSSLVDIRWLPLPLRSVDALTLSNPALFYRIGDPLEQDARIVKIDNLCDKDVFISSNGVTAFTIIPSGGFFVIDIATNQTNGGALLVDAGTQFWANSAATPTTGDIYITAISSTSG